MSERSVNLQKWGKLWDRAELLVLQGKPCPLSPLWEQFIIDFLVPGHEGYPARAAAGKAIEIGQEKRAMYQRSCTLSPFDFTDEWVNRHRARNFRELLDSVRKSLAQRRQPRRAWWPASRTEMIGLIMKEQGTKQAAGGGKGGGEGVGGVVSAEGSSSSRNSIKEEPHGVAPLGSGGEQKHFAKPSSSNKRKADDTSSTKATTELLATSTENSGVKIKRQRKAE